MAVSDDHLNVAAGALRSTLTHVGLVDGNGTELTGGSYARIAEAWTAPNGGRIQLAADRTFDVPAGATVAGWRAYEAATGGSSTTGYPLTSETYSLAGAYTLQAAGTYIDFDNAP